ncbi:MAG: hypothetical protein WBW32_01235 [Luteibacter sp.]
MFDIAVIEIERAHRDAPKIPASCQPERLTALAGFGALVAVGGFAGGPVIGIPSVALGASGGAVLGLLNCAHDLRDANR